MRSKHHLSLTLVYFLAIATLFLSASVEAKPKPKPKPKATTTNPFCKTVNNKPLCNKMVRRAKTWHEAKANAIKTTLDFVKVEKPKMKTLDVAAASFKRAVTAKSVKAACKESFDDVVGNLEEALKALKARDRFSMDSKLSASEEALDDCNTAFREFGKAILPLARFSRDVRMYVNICLALAQHK